MNYLVTFSGHDYIADEKQANSNYNQKELTPSVLKFLKSYWEKNDEDELQAIVEQSQQSVNIENLFKELDQYAAKFFNTEVSLSLKFREDTIAISQSKDTIYMNTLMSTVLWSYIATQIYHSYVLDTYGRGSVEDRFCYQYTLFILNDMCFNEFKQPVVLPNEESAGLLLSKMEDKPNLLAISSNIFYSALAFALLHEISHAYLNHDEKTVGIEKEMEADEKAYLIYLNFCYDVQNDKISSNFKDCLKSYTYMAPMYLLDFYYVVYYTGSFLCPYHPAAGKEMFDDIVARKEALFDVFYSWESDTDPDEAYDMYNIYLDGAESFLRSFVASDKAGMLDIIKERNCDRRHE